MKFEFETHLELNMRAVLLLLEAVDVLVLQVDGVGELVDGRLQLGQLHGRRRRRRSSRGQRLTLLLLLLLLLLLMSPLLLLLLFAAVILVGVCRRNRDRDEIGRREGAAHRYRCCSCSCRRLLQVLDADAAIGHVHFAEQLLLLLLVADGGGGHGGQRGRRRRELEQLLEWRGAICGRGRGGLIDVGDELVAFAFAARSHHHVHDLFVYRVQAVVVRRGLGRR